MTKPPAKSPTVRRKLALPKALPSRPATPPSNAELLARRRGSTAGLSETLLLCDFDNTLTDFDAGGLRRPVISHK